VEVVPIPTVGPLVATLGNRVQVVHVCACGETPGAVLVVENFMKTASGVLKQFSIFIV